MYSASPCFTVPLPGGRPWPSGRMAMSQPAISSGAAARPIPRRLAAATACAGAAAAGRGERPASCARPPPITTRLAATARRIASRHFDILHPPALAPVPGLDAIVVVDGSHPADLSALRPSRLDVARLRD